MLMFDTRGLIKNYFSSSRTARWLIQLANYLFIFENGLAALVRFSVCLSCIHVYAFIAEGVGIT